MKTVILPSVFILFCAIGAQAQQFEEKTVAMFCNATLMEKILDEKEVEYESSEFNVYQIQLNEYSVMMKIEDGDLILRTWFIGQSPSLNRVNDFNHKYRWGRAYIDSDGDLTYGSELSFEDGIGIGGVHTFLNTYGRLLEVLRGHMN